MAKKKEARNYSVALRGREDIVTIRAVTSTNRGGERLEFLDADGEVGAAFRLNEVQGWWLKG